MARSAGRPGRTLAVSHDRAAADGTEEASVSDATTTQEQGPEATAPEDDSDYEAYIGEPTDADYLARFGEEAAR